MEIKHIKELMAVMGRTGTQKLRIKKDGFELELEKQPNGKVAEALEYPDEIAIRQEQTFQRAAMPLPRGIEPPMAAAAQRAPEGEPPAGAYVTSPMVGTFYNAPSPDDPPFVKPGDKIEKNSVVCIIEAMKVMNEVKAGVSGTVAEVLIDNGHPVEFGTKLIRIV